MKKVIALCTAIVLTFGGCSLKRTGSAESMPEDKPWNRIVMETDKGYYYAGSYSVMSLRYTEKSNGADIFLCAKPECSHNGEDTCTATYRFLPVSNYILYEGSIYFVADTPTSDTVGITLYKASLDGTSIDKVGDVRRVKYSDDSSSWSGMPKFIIHKGFAYITYDLSKDLSYSGFIENGFMKMNIKTGETETIFSNDTFLTSVPANVYAGCGDYVYYNAYGNNTNGIFRYNINNGECEKISDILNLDFAHEGLSGITESTLYTVHGDKKEYRINGYDSKTLEPNGTVIDLYSDYKNIGNYFSILYYDNKIFVCENDVIKVFSDKGELIGSHSCPSYLKEGESGYRAFDPRKFDISDGKLYISYPDNMSDADDKPVDLIDNSFYYCSVENIISGAGEWEKAYTIKSEDEYWDVDPIPKFIIENSPDDVE